MIYLLAIFVSPLYFLIKQKWLAFIVHAILYPIALFTIMFFGFGIFLWAILAAHAGWDLRHQRDQEMAKAMAKEMVSAMEHREQPASNPAG